MTRRTQELWATFAVGVVGITWGCWWIFLRLIEARGISPGWTLATVYGASGLLLLPLFVWRWRQWRLRAWPMMAVGVAYGLPLAFWSHAVIHGNVVRVTLLFYMTPVWGTLLAVTAFGERLTPLRLLAVVLGLIGAGAVLGLDQGIPIPRSTQEWMALLAGALFALAAAASRRWPAVSGYDSTFVMFLFSALLGILFAGLFGGETVPAASAVFSSLPLVVFLSVVFAIPSQFVLCWAAARLDPGRVSTLIMFDVLATTVSARLLTSEPFGWPELVGCLAILAAGVTSGVDQMRQSRLALARQPTH